MTTASNPTADAGPVVVVVAGTGTEVGKTWVTARVIEMLVAEGCRVAARKPAQSHEPGDLDTDAALLAAASGEAIDRVCPPHRDYEVSMAPPMAAAVLDLPSFTVSDLVSELACPPDVDVLFVESAGGVRSPLAADGDTTDLIEILEPDLVILVTDVELGVINSVRLATSALAPRRPVVVLNRFDERSELHRRNHAWLTDVDLADVLIGPEQLAARLLALIRL